MVPISQQLIMTKFKDREITSMRTGKQIFFRLFNYENLKPEKVLLMLGGDGNDSARFNEVSSSIAGTFNNSVVINMSFSGVEDEDKGDAYRSVDELRDLLDYLAESYGDIDVYGWTISAGAYAFTMASLDKVASKNIKYICFIDPIDSYIDNPNVYWSGHESYEPESKTISSLWKELESEMLIDIVPLVLKETDTVNYIEDISLVPESKRFPRINQDAVRSHWEHIPKANHGMYFEIGDVSHKFDKRGDIAYNIARISTFLTRRIVEVSMLNNLKG